VPGWQVCARAGHTHTLSWGVQHSVGELQLPSISALAPPNAFHPPPPAVYTAFTRPAWAAFLMVLCILWFSNPTAVLARFLSAGVWYVQPVACLQFVWGL
jgi:hypothetical protein